jgi:hypothetical protein
MKVLVDTHTFLWDLLGDHRSSRLAKQILKSDEHQLFFSLVSLWEFSTKRTAARANGAFGGCPASPPTRLTLQSLPAPPEPSLRQSLPSRHSGLGFIESRISVFFRCTIPPSSKSKPLEILSSP